MWRFLRIGFAVMLPALVLAILAMDLVVELR